MIFRVNIGYYSFDIPDDNTGLSFAELAKTYVVQDKNYPIDVGITLMTEEEVLDNE
jgi:hypothetical protein